jgi:hypothetical protein
MEMKWKVLTVYSWHEGPVVFTAIRDDNPNVFLFRWGGGDRNDRLFESDCHSNMKTPFYAKFSDLDLTAYPQFERVDTSPKV